MKRKINIKEPNKCICDKKIVDEFYNINVNDICADVCVECFEKYKTDNCNPIHYKNIEGYWWII